MDLQLDFRVEKHEVEGAEHPACARSRAAVVIIIGFLFITPRSRRHPLLAVTSSPSLSVITKITGRPEAAKRRTTEREPETVPRHRERGRGTGTRHPRGRRRTRETRREQDTKRGGSGVVRPRRPRLGPDAATEDGERERDTHGGRGTGTSHAPNEPDSVPAAPATDQKRGDAGSQTATPNPVIGVFGPAPPTRNGNPTPK